MSNVKIIKFLSGQEIIGKVMSDDDINGVVVESPLTIQPMKQGDQFSLGLMPFSWAGSAKSVNLNPSHVLCTMDAEPDLETQYLSGLAGLTPPPSRKLTLVE